MADVNADPLAVAKERALTIHEVENLAAQRDDALARIATAMATVAAKEESQKKRLDDAVKDKADALAKADSAHDATVKHWQEQLAAQQQSHEQSIGRMGEACDKRVAELESELLTVRTKLTEAEQLIAALGGTELGQKMAKEARAAELQANIDAAMAELKRLAG